MTPSDQYSALLSCLTAARSQMLSSEWQNSLDAATQPVRVAAGNALIQLQSAILTLSTANLSDIAKAMQANESTLTAATADLNAALQGLANVANVLTKVTNILGVVAKVLPLL
jgi:hypothetical protein